MVATEKDYSRRSSQHSNNKEGERERERETNEIREEEIAQERM
jgi:hypothetical protein